MRFPGRGLPLKSSAVIGVEGKRRQSPKFGLRLVEKLEEPGAHVPYGTSRGCA